MARSSTTAPYAGVLEKGPRLFFVHERSRPNFREESALETLL